MPTKLPRLKEKCKYRKCRHIVSRTQNQKDKGRFDYCSIRCARLDMVRRVYDAKTLKYVQEHLHTDGYESVAKHLKVTVVALKRQLSVWRGEGHVIKGCARYSLPIGTESMRKYSGRMRKFVKTKTGWRPVKLDKPKQLFNAKPVKPVKPVQNKTQNIGRPRNLPKQQVKQFKTVVRDPANMKKVKVNRNTWVEADKSVPDSVVIERWNKKHAP